MCETHRTDDAVRIEGQTAKTRSRLYFDTQSGLLLKSHGEVLTPLRSYPFETRFTDYPDVNGIMFPGAWTVLGTSGGIRFKLSEFQVNAAIDPNNSIRRLRSNTLFYGLTRGSS
jgi:hypothetical protein